MPPPRLKVPPSLAMARLVESVQLLSVSVPARVGDAAAVAVGEVTGNGAAGERERAVIVDAAAVVADGVAVDDGQAAQGRGYAAVNPGELG